ncbi:MAG: signal peptidase II [Planctomycetaceae bacterium]
MPGSFRRWPWFVYLALLTLADLTTKAWVFARLGYEHRTSDWQFSSPCLWGQVRLQLRTSFNRGALLGVGPGLTWVYAGIAGLVVGAIGCWLWRRESSDWRLSLALGGVAAGTLGNLHDRLGWHGCRDEAGQPIYAVRDFLDCTTPFFECRSLFDWRLASEFEWPLFNLADVWLVVGVAVLVARWSRTPPTVPPASKTT